MKSKAELCMGKQGRALGSHFPRLICSWGARSVLAEGTLSGKTLLVCVEVPCNDHTRVRTMSASRADWRATFSIGIVAPCFNKNAVRRTADFGTLTNISALSDPPPPTLPPLPSLFPCLRSSLLFKVLAAMIWDSGRIQGESSGSRESQDLGRKRELASKEGEERERGKGISVATMEVIGRFGCWVEVLNCATELDTVLGDLQKTVHSSMFLP